MNIGAISDAPLTVSPPQWFQVDRHGLLTAVRDDALTPDAPQVRRLPYGALALPVTGANGDAVVVFKQPGVVGRRDVLIIDKPASLAIVSATLGEIEDRQRTRVRVAMEHVANDAGDRPASVAVVRFATSAGPGQLLDAATKSLLAAVAYSLRTNDQAGWFERGDDACPDLDFRHGHPDIATREQGIAGIRGPSWLVAGLRPRIRSDLFAPRRPLPIDPGQRTIYELHVGTFTSAGTFDAAAERLPYLRRIGFTTVQLMPVDIGSGPPGWTYDQTRTGAVERAAYGGAEALIRFVERAHENGLEVIVDKQYNHEGPEQDSRAQIIPDMFTTVTTWGHGLSGRNVSTYSQILKLIGEELASWVTDFGVDGFRLDATNRLPWDLHEQIARFGQAISDAVGKPLYLLSEYAEPEEPRGLRVPSRHQYADATGRYLMKLLGLSNARHVTSLVGDGGSILRAMLKSARRGWWYPDIPPPKDGLGTSERAVALLWHHDWIGNRFGGERISDLVTFGVFKAIAVWQMLGAWTPLLFMGTERYASTRWYFFTGHGDASTRNNSSAYYEVEDGVPQLKGGRFCEFAQEAREAGLKDALWFSADNTLAGIDWAAFRKQKDRFGKPYRDPSDPDTFNASQLIWAEREDHEQRAIETLFEKLTHARQDPRLRDDRPLNTQYKAWEEHERVFVFRRRATHEQEFLALFNLGDDPISMHLSAEGVEIPGANKPYLVGLDESSHEVEWSGAGRYSLWLDTNDQRYAGPAPSKAVNFEIGVDRSKSIQVAAGTALVFSVEHADEPGARN